RPAVVRLYDEFDTMMALSGKSEKHAGRKSLRALLEERESGADLFGLFPFLKSKAIGAALRNASLVNRLADGVGKKARLITMFEGPRAGTELEAAEAARMFAEKGGSDLGAAPAERWKARRYAISYNQS